LNRKLKNILLKIEYDGTDYKGWQTQRVFGSRSKTKTIQQTLENVLIKILKEPVKLFASGRTDSGVHAQGQIANFKTHTQIPLTKLKIALNSLLPCDIRIKTVKQVGLDFHARYDAKSKVYQYAILNKSEHSVFTRNFSTHIRYPLDIGLMRKEARAFLGKHDFKSFQASDKRVRNSVRTIKMISVKKQRGYIYIDICADGFVYNMVRNIVGTLIEVGRGKLQAGSIKRILKAANRKYAGPTASARGLRLLKVNYT